MTDASSGKSGYGYGNHGKYGKYSKYVKKSYGYGKFRGKTTRKEQEFIDAANDIFVGGSDPDDVEVYSDTDDS